MIKGFKCTRKILTASSAMAIAAIFGFAAFWSASDSSFASQVQMGDFFELQPYGHMTIWEHSGFKGKSLSMDVLGGPGMVDVFLGTDRFCNDCLTSFQIGRGVRAYICDNLYC